MPVPSSFNDITQNASLRDYVGWVWYDRQVWIPDSWIKDSKIIRLRFGSVYYNAAVVSCLIPKNKNYILINACFILSTRVDFLES